MSSSIELQKLKKAISPAPTRPKEVSKPGRMDQSLIYIKEEKGFQGYLMNMRL